MKHINIVAAPKPFFDKIHDIQKRSIENWLSLGEEIRVFLICAAPPPDSIGGLERVSVIYDSSLRPGVAPEFNQLLGLINLGQDEVVVYTNADMLYTSEFAQVVRNRAEAGQLLVGYRFDVSAGIELPAASTELHGFFAEALGKKWITKHPYTGIDYFAAKVACWNGLGKAFVGRAGIDGALLAHALGAQTPIADGTGAFYALHQFHDYAHLKGGKQTAWTGEEARHNLNYHKVRYGPPTLLDVDFVWDGVDWVAADRRGRRLRMMELYLRFRMKCSGVGMLFAGFRKIWNARR